MEVNWEEAQAIVLDFGSYTVKAGFAGDDAPRVVFPALVGRPKHQEIMVGMEQKEIFIGDEAHAKKGVLQISFPVQRGIVRNWDTLEKVWHHTFYNELRIEPSEHPILITEAPLNPRANRERLCQTMFNTFNIQGFFIATAAVLSIYASGRGTALCLDSGDGVTHAVPVYEGYSMVHAIKRINLGGSDVTENLRRLLTERGYAFNSSSEKDIVRDIKEVCCYVTKNFENELERAAESSFLEKDYQLPDGNVITVGNERFRAVEVLFQPSLVGKESLNVVDVVHQTIQACGIDTRLMFYGNIVLSGGNTMFEGMAERIELEIKALVPNARWVKTVAHPERKYSAWIGGSILASLSTFQRSWLSRDDYEDEGPEVVHEHCLL